MAKKIIQSFSQTDYDSTVKHHDNLITALIEEVKTLSSLAYESAVFHGTGSCSLNNELNMVVKGVFQFWRELLLRDH